MRERERERERERGGGMWWRVMDSCIRTVKQVMWGIMPLGSEVCCSGLNHIGPCVLPLPPPLNFPFGNTPRKEAVNIRDSLCCGMLPWAENCFPAWPTVSSPSSLTSTLGIFPQICCCWIACPAVTGCCLQGWLPLFRPICSLLDTITPSIVDAAMPHGTGKPEVVCGYFSLSVFPTSLTN